MLMKILKPMENLEVGRGNLVQLVSMLIVGVLSSQLSLMIDKYLKFWYSNLEGNMIFKEFQIIKDAKASDNNNETFSFVASSGTPDRLGDVVSPSGWDLKNYKKNPIILLGHDPSSLPIGKAKNIRFSDERLWKDRNLLLDIEFDMQDPISSRIASKVKNGFINSVSVGFNPKDAIKRSDLEENHWAYTTKGGTFFKSSELLEVSIVSIPANPSATILQHYTPNDLTQAIKKLLQEDYLSQIDPLMQISSKILHIESIKGEIIIRLKDTEQTRKIINTSFPNIEIKAIYGFNHYLVSALVSE
ncbi:hypothetical protein CL634_09330 [bacterium]|nr:hypothetical protein [bacterium]